MNVQDLSNKNGLLPIRLGDARLITSYNELVHIVQLDKYADNIQKIQKTLDTLGTNEEISSTLEITKTKLKETNNKLISLMPKTRNRRGLINGLGTIIKTITGNLDANDAIRINSKINQILNNENVINKQINQQTQLNQQMIKRFENITNHINHQQTTITSYLKYIQETAQNKIKQDNTNWKYSQFLNQINFNIDLLNDHLTGISEAIILAKLNIISKMILDPNELSEIQLMFENQSLNITSNEQMYELLKLQAYANGTNIIFNIQIPVLHNESFTIFHIIPLPLENSKIISAKPYLLLNPKHIQNVDSGCENIEGTYYCPQTADLQDSTDSRCIGNLLNNKPAHCEFYNWENEMEIFEPEPNHIVLINTPATTINTTCGPDSMVLNGTLLIQFKDCEITINNVIYSSKKLFHWNEINIYPTTLNKINITSLKGPDIKFKELQKYQFVKRQPNETLPIPIEQKDIYTLLTIISILIIVNIIFYTSTLRRFSAKLINRRDVKPIAPASSTTRTRFIWPSLESKGGEVMSP